MRFDAGLWWVTTNKNSDRHTIAALQKWIIEAQPQVFDLLQYLIANRDRVVSMAISTQSGGHFTVSRPNPRVSHSRRCALAILRPAPTRISSVAHDANPVISIYDGRSPADVAGTFATARALMMLGYMRSSTATGRSRRHTVLNAMVRPRLAHGHGSLPRGHRRTMTTKAIANIKIVSHAGRKLRPTGI